MKIFLKENLRYALPSFFLGILCVVLGAIIQPILRSGNTALTSALIVCYALSFIASIVLSWIIFYKLKLNMNIIAKYKNRFSIIYYFATIVILSIVLTIAYAILTKVNPESIYLTQGILSISLVLAYYLGLSLPVLINSNFLH